MLVCRRSTHMRPEAGRLVEGRRDGLTAAAAAHHRQHLPEVAAHHKDLAAKWGAWAGGEVPQRAVDGLKHMLVHHGRLIP
jgi:hypothetical protein